jgi:tRNA-specific 2-thiouridylase
MRRIVLAMSGGVDSSASAVLLQRQGYEVIGLFMRSGAAEEQVCATTTAPLPVLASKPHKQGCCSAVDAADARRVADRLDIPFHALNFADAFGRIKDYFADEYLAGRTPNPCVMCNNWLKFGKLWEFAEQVGADAIATGHYARIVRNGDGHPRLLRGRDPAKDQSYVLFGIRRELLERIVFPVGDATKAEIRAVASEAGLRVASKPDSQDICFVPQHDYAAFLRRHRQVGETGGEFVDPHGRVLGHHPGYERFTIGQRRGLGVAFGEPRFVIRIEPESRRVVLGTQADLACPGLIADRLNWLVDVPASPFRCHAQIRYQHTAAPATVTIEADDQLSVRFDDPQCGVAPGQAVVFYDGDRVLGGGWIRGSLSAEMSNDEFRMTNDEAQR